MRYDSVLGFAAVGKLKKTVPKYSEANRASAGNAKLPSIQLDIPKALSKDGPYAIWKPGGPGRMLAQLAREHAFGESTLKPEQLAELVELFRDEPLPESLRKAVALQLKGKRVLQQGAPRKGQSAQAQCELVMLPYAYREAMKAQHIHHSH